MKRCKCCNSGWILPDAPVGSLLLHGRLAVRSVRQVRQGKGTPPWNGRAVRHSAVDSPALSLAAVNVEVDTKRKASSQFVYSPRAEVARRCAFPVRPSPCARRQIFLAHRCCRNVHHVAPTLLIFSRGQTEWMTSQCHQTESPASSFGMLVNASINSGCHCLIPATSLPARYAAQFILRHIIQQRT